MRRRTLIGSLSLSLALAGALIAVGVAAASRRSNERLAERTASRLLEEVPLPEGAKRVSSDESVDAGLKGPATKPATPHLLDKHRYWHVDGQGEAVISWIEEHPPAGSKIALRGSSGKPTGQPPRSLHGPALAEWVRQHTVTTGWDTTFAFPEQRERLATVWLSVSVAAAKGGGSEIRADALVVPRRPRPAAEHIPRRVGEVTVKVNDPRRHLRFTRQIGNRNTPARTTPSSSTTRTCWHRSAPSAIAMTTRSPRASSTATRPS